MSVRQVTTTIKPGADSLTIEAISHLYNFKLVAALRENIGNALDAMVEAGKQDTPVDVHLYPKPGALRFVISDTGVGMSADEVADNYLSVEVSRKRDRDDLIGGHGIGVLATFTSTDTLTVVTTKDGKTTLVTGNDHGGGDITWTLVDSPVVREQGTSVDFTVTTDGDDTAGISQYLMLVSYMRNVRVHAHPLENTDDGSYWSLPIESHARLNATHGSGMATIEDDVVVFYPHALLADTSRAVTAIDLDFVIGTREGAVAVPYIAPGRNHVPVSRVMAMVGGLPYRVGVDSPNMDSLDYITVLTSEYIEENMDDFEVVSIPRNREYVEAKGRDAMVFSHGLFSESDFMLLVRPYLDGVLDEYENVLDSLGDESAKYLSDASTDKAAAFFPTVEQALARSIGATGPLINGYAYANYSHAPYIDQLRHTVLEDRVYGAEAAEAMAAAIRNRCVDAVFMNTHAATNADVEHGIKDDERVTTAHAVEALRAVTAKYASRKYEAVYSAVNELNEKLSVYRVSDKIPARLLSKDERRSLVAIHGRAAHTVVVVPADATVKDVALTRAYEALYNYLANMRLAQSEPVGKYDAMTLTDSSFTRSLFGRRDPWNAPKLSEQDGTGVNGEITWKSLSTQTPAARRKANAPEWAFQVRVLHADGTFDVERELLTTKDFNQTIKDDSVFSVSLNGTKFSRNVQIPVPAYTDNTIRNSGVHLEVEHAGYAALYAVGYRKLYFYDDKNGTNPDKVSRENWIEPWNTHAVPAMHDKANEIIQALLRKSYLSSFVSKKFSMLFVPATNAHAVGDILTAAIGEGYTSSVPYGVVGNTTYAVMEAVYEQVKGTIPRQFVLPTPPSRTDDEDDARKAYNLSRTYLGKLTTPESDVVVGYPTAETMNALSTRHLTDDDDDLLKTTLTATTVTWDQDTLNDLARIYDEIEQVWNETQDDDGVAFSRSARYFGRIDAVDAPTSGKKKELYDELVATVTPIATAWVTNQWNLLLRLYSMRSANADALTSERIMSMFTELEQVSQA